MSELPLEVQQALKLTFPKSVAGFSIDASFDAPSLQGQIYCDTGTGQPDGTIIKTEPVVSFGSFEGYSTVLTVDGNIYIIARSAPRRIRPILPHEGDDESSSAEDEGRG